jgi:1-phosphatidylinositol-4-phosphate 5-kinase
VWHTVVMPLASGGDTVTGRLCKRLKATCGSRGSADLTSGILPHVQDVRTSCPPRIESGRSGAAASAAATAAVPRVSGEDSVELNVALQGEILYFLLLGLRAAADDNRAEINLAAAARSDHVVAHMMEESERLHGHKWTLDDCEASLERWNFQFTSYRGEEFRSLRTSFGVGQDEYRTSMSRYTKAVFDGGGSGAIMFYSGDERFVVKQITKEESQVLQEMLTNYARHVERGGSSTTEEEEEEEEEEEGSDSGAVGGRERQQHSLLPRIVQCVRIQMYATSLYFMVTENIMYHAEGEGEVTETYDLKGSWVNRNATLPRRGQAARCRHCNERYVVGEPGPSAEDGGCDGTPSSSSSSSSNGSGHRACSASANREHAPRVTFKDGDLIHKVYLDEDRRDTLLSTLRRDAEFLREHGIMDYSLLLGVRHRRYKIGEAPVGIAGHLRSSGNYSNCELSDDQLPGMVASGDSSRAFSVSAPDSSSEVGHSSAAGSNTAGSGAASSSLAGSGRVSGRVSASSRRVSDRASSTRTLDIERPSLTESRMRLEGNPSLPFFREDKGGLAAAMVVGAETYYVGVIDILQRWTWRKWFELQWKSVVLRSDRAGLSVMEPEQYSERWAQMVEGITEVPAELR